MNAIILAGGLGTRLRPLTNETPKPLLPVRGKPIVEHAILNLKKYGVDDIVLSIGYKAEKIKDYFGDGAKWGVKISYHVEEKPLGTGGAIKASAKNMTDPVFVVWGDNLTDVDYAKLSQAFSKYNNTLTMVLTPRHDVENFGVAKLEGDKVISFVEKPKPEEAPSNLINAGAILLDPLKLSILPEGVSSIEYDFYEKLSPGEITAYIHEGQWYPTDTLEKYKYADENFVPLVE